MIQLISKVNTI